jgi:hypothetical protein
VQEIHLSLVHALCIALDKALHDKALHDEALQEDEW